MGAAVPQKTTPSRLEYLHSKAIRRLRTAPLEWSPALSKIVSYSRFPIWAEDNHNRYYLYLAALIRELKPVNVLELGTKDGASALFMLSALPNDSRFQTIDLNPSPILLEGVLSDQRLTIITADDLDPRFSLTLEAQDPIDLLFMDTEHNSDQLSAELEKYSEFLRPGAIVVVDDIHLNSEMEHWWASLPYEKIDTGLMLHHSGFGIFEYQPIPTTKAETQKPKLSVLYFLHDDSLYLEESIKSAKAFGDIFAFISKTAWHGEHGDWKASEKIAKNAGATVVLGEWFSESEHRQAAIRYLRSLGYTHALIPDGDEIIEPRLLTELRKMAENRLADRVYVQWDTYWKTPEYVIRPREQFTPLLLIDLRQTFHLRLRDFGGGRPLHLSADFGIVHHLSYCGPDSRIERKISSWGHRNEVHPDWFEHVWRKWDEDRTMHDLHPTHPKAYGFAERIPVIDLLNGALERYRSAGAGEAQGQVCPGSSANWPKVSIVIPVHGQASLLEKCLSSLESIRSLWHEVIIVDNASPDRAPHLGSQFSWARTIDNGQNLGFARACNQGHKIATGSIVLFLNSDTIVPRAGFIRLIESFSHSNSIAAAGPYSNQAGHFQQTGVTYTTAAHLELFANDFAYRPNQDTDTDMLSGFCLAVRKGVLDEVGGFDERFGIGLFEDNDLCYRIRRAGYRLVISARSFVHHVGSGTLGNSPDIGKLFDENRRKYEMKWREDLEIGYASNLSGLTAEGITFTPKRKPETLKAELARKARQVRISLCMIVKDEERVLRECLSSVAEVFPEIVIVDTGSTDKTKEIIRDFGATLIDSTWHDSFSVARNESIAAASGKWIFWIDADDTVPLLSAEHLINEILNAPSDVHGFIVPVQFVDEGPGSGTRVDHVKAFRKLPGVGFEGRIHEQVLPSLKEHGGKIVRSKAVVLHSGYDTSVPGQKKKADREDHLLWLDHKERPNHPFPSFNLGMTFHYRGDQVGAVKWLRRCAKQCDPADSILRKVYCLLGGSLKQLGKPAQAMKAFRDGLRAAPDDVELHFCLAQLLSESGNHKEAIENYRKCLTLSSDQYFSSFDTGIRSFKTLHNLAIEHLAIGEIDEAMVALRNAIVTGNSFIPSAALLFKVSMDRNDLSAAREAMEVVRNAEGMSQEWAAMAAFYTEATQGSEGVIGFLSRALQSEPDSVAVRHLLSARLLAAGRETEAMQHWPILAQSGIAESAFFMGVALSRAGDFEGALSWMVRAHELNPAHLDTVTQIEALEKLLQVKE